MISLDTWINKEKIGKVEILDLELHTYDSVTAAATAAVVPTVATATPTNTFLGIGKVVSLLSETPSVLFLLWSIENRSNLLNDVFNMRQSLNHFIACRTKQVAGERNNHYWVFGIDMRGIENAKEL